jgi:hypothetical protein
VGARTNTRWGEVGAGGAACRDADGGQLLRACVCVCVLTSGTLPSLTVSYLSDPERQYVTRCDLVMVHVFTCARAHTHDHTRACAHLLRRRRRCAKRRELPMPALGLLLPLRRGRSSRAACSCGCRRYCGPAPIERWADDEWAAW